jgi:AraC-like DNA-binding protein
MQADDTPVPASYLLAFIEAMGLDSGELNPLLKQLGLPGDLPDTPPATVSLRQLLEALRWIDARAVPGWHIEPTLALEASHHGPLGLAVVTAENVAKALECLIRYEPTRAPWTLLRQQNRLDRVELDVMPVRDLAPAGELLMEINLIALAALIGQLLGSHVRSMEVVLPAGYRAWEARLKAELPGSTRLSGSRWQISLPRQLLERRCLMADPVLHQSAVARCQALLLELASDGPLASRVRQRLLELEGHSPGAERMAVTLGLSTRSLSRQLGSEGTSYREQVDRVRRTLARDLLLSHRWPVGRIAEHLGYADPANFGRAFRRWYGCSPGQMRLKVLDHDRSTTG